LNANDVALNANGVPQQSPGLARGTSAYPRLPSPPATNPNGVAQQRTGLVCAKQTYYPITYENSHYLAHELYGGFIRKKTRYTISELKTDFKHGPSLYRRFPNLLVLEGKQVWKPAIQGASIV
jgi:hypothetical protein